MYRYMYIQIIQMHILPPPHCKNNWCGVSNTCPTLPTSTPIRLNIYIARAVRDLKYAADDGRRQRCNHLLPLAELRRERRRAPHTSLVTTRGRCARTAGDGPSPSCLSSSCAVAHSRQHRYWWLPPRCNRNGSGDGRRSMRRYGAAAPRGDVHVGI